MVIDTNIFIEFLRTKDKKKTELFRLINSSQLYISSVTLYELLMGATNNEKMADIKVLTDDLPVLPFDDMVARKAAQIYHDLRTENKMIDYRDIFIAATCIVYDLPLKTLNKKHFNRIEELKLG
jgi:tRNA(fMet)-specific endonuclease VapC